MGKQYTNLSKNASAWEVQVQKPLDDRSVVSSYNDLLKSETWVSKDGNYYHYKGMVVSCANTGSIYTYIGDTGDALDVTNPANWIKSSSGSVAGSNVDIAVTTVEPTTYAELELAWQQEKLVTAIAGNIVVYYNNQDFTSKMYIKLNNTVWATFAGSIFSEEATPVATIASVNVLSYK